jgi:serine protease Do
MHRLFAALAALLLLVLPSAVRPDPADIAAAARGVVRVVIMGTDGDTVFPVSHGSGFAVSPTRIVTNAHVIREAREDDSLRIAIVPPDGDSADYARIVAVSEAKDLAVLETTGKLRLPPLTLAGGAAGDGEEVTAVGYPMNVDRAQGLDIADLFRPQPPVKSRGFLSGSRPSRDIDTLLHTAAIARGNSGGPLLDPCGRVVGVNSFGTVSDEGGDAEFSFAVSRKELAPFLRGAGVQPPVNASPCRSLAQLDEAERERLAAEQAAARAQLAERAEGTRARRERAQLEAGFEVLSERENAMALAGLLILFATGSGLAAWNLRRTPDGGKTARIAGGLAAAAGIAALAVWFTRPGLDAIDRRVADAMAEAARPPDQLQTNRDRPADLICTLEPERSRVIGEPQEELDFAWRPGGCVNGRTQYGFADGQWTRLFVPNDEDTVSVNRFDPATRTFRADRYPLSQSAMAKARSARAAYKAPQCGAQDAAASLGEMQSGVAALLSGQPIERLIYSCRER